MDQNRGSEIDLFPDHKQNDAPWRVLLLLVSRTGFGHELLARMIHYVFILDKYSRNLQFQCRLSLVFFVPCKLVGNLLRSYEYSLLTHLDCFGSREVAQTCLRSSNPDARKAVCVLPDHKQNDAPWRVLLLLVSRTGFEPARDNSHYPLKVARLPISPPGHVRIRSLSIMHESKPNCNATHPAMPAGHRLAPPRRRGYQHVTQKWSHHARDTIL